MLPRSSIVTSRFTSTRLRASLRDPLARLTETIAGRSCGVMPMAIASENRSASISGRESTTLMMKIETQRTPATFTSRPEKSRRPTWNAVSACRSESPAAIEPKAVAFPVETTTPSPAPWWTTVPMKAQDGRSRGESPAEAAIVFSTGSDSPVSTASSHSSCVTSSSRRSAGTTSPTRSATMSPGTSSATSSRICAPSRTAIVV